MKHQASKKDSLEFAAEKSLDDGLETFTMMNNSLRDTNQQLVFQVSTAGGNWRGPEDESKTTLYVAPLSLNTRTNKSMLNSPETLSINSPMVQDELPSELKMRAKYEDIEERDSVKVLCGEHDMRTNNQYGIT